MQDNKYIYQLAGQSAIPTDDFISDITYQMRKNVLMSDYFTISLTDSQPMKKVNPKKKKSSKHKKDEKEET